MPFVKCGVSVASGMKQMKKYSPFAMVASTCVLCPGMTP